MQAQANHDDPDIQIMFAQNNAGPHQQRMLREACENLMQIDANATHPGVNLTLRMKTVASVAGLAADTSDMPDGCFFALASAVLWKAAVARAKGAQIHDAMTTGMTALHKEDGSKTLDALDKEAQGDKQ